MSRRVLNTCGFMRWKISFPLLVDYGRRAVCCSDNAAHVFDREIISGGGASSSRSSAAGRRELAPFLKAEAVEHLGVNAKALGKKFDLQVRALAEKGLSIRAIARVLN